MKVTKAPPSLQLPTILSPQPFLSNTSPDPQVSVEGTEEVKGPSNVNPNTSPLR